VTVARLTSGQLPLVREPRWRFDLARDEPIRIPSILVSLSEGGASGHGDFVGFPGPVSLTIRFSLMLSL